MIDTIAFKIPLRHKTLASDTFTKSDKHGEIIYTTRGNSVIEGTYSANAILRSIRHDETGTATYLRVECSPKFVQGHNIFGTEKTSLLVYKIIKELKTSLSDDLPELATYEFNDETIEIDRIDINRMFELPTAADVNNWIRSAQYTSHTRSGRPVLKGTTLYFQPNSRRWSIKAYNKGQEVQVHKIKHGLDWHIKKLISLTDKYLRLEVTFRQLELRQNDIKYLYQITDCEIDYLYRSYIGKLKMTEKLKLTHAEFEKLPKPLRKTYAIWQSGNHPIEFISKATFYRHRKDLLEFGIDISNPFATDKTNIIPLIRVLEAKPVETPDWVISSGLVIAA